MIVDDDGVGSMPLLAQYLRTTTDFVLLEPLDSSPLLAMITITSHRMHEQ